MIHREICFECLFADGGTPGTLLVRAWNADEAEAAARATLKAAGIAAPERLRLRPLSRGPTAPPAPTPRRAA